MDELLLALAKAVTAIWSNLPQDIQHELFEHAVSAQDDATRERLAIFLHAIHFRTTDAINRAPSRSPTVRGGNAQRPGSRCRRGRVGLQVKLARP